MTKKTSALTARTQLGQIMNRAIENGDRFLVERNGEPAVLILSVADYIKTFAPPPDSLVAASRRERRARKANLSPADDPYRPRHERPRSLWCG